MANLASILATNSSLLVSLRYLTNEDIDPFKLEAPIPSLNALEIIAWKYSWPSTFV